LCVRLNAQQIQIYFTTSTIRSWKRNKNGSQNKTLRKLLELFADRSIQ
jgi:hypothetical protein